MALKRQTQDNTAVKNFKVPSPVRDKRNLYSWGKCLLTCSKSSLMKNVREAQVHNNLWSGKPENSAINTVSKDWLQQRAGREK